MKILITFFIIVSNEVIMKKILLIAIGIIVLLQIPALAKSKLIRTLSNVQNRYDYNSVYGDDLLVVEEYLFGAYFDNDNVQSRINRIERNLFSQCYPTLSMAQRMNNILANYRNKESRNYLSDYKGRNSFLSRRIRNYFFGQPTGFTPPIINMPFNDYGRPYGMNRSFYSSKGSYYYNNKSPAGASFGVHVLDD
jgi:hypothetical protein